MNDNYKYGDGDEEILDKSARESIVSVKYLHSRLINAIDVNTENLNKLNFTQSSMFAIPSECSYITSWCWFKYASHTNGK
ncbi:hypothetical protein PrNR1418_13000 [Providencia rettgeri]|nr:hypothetical protein PrNR1418_13000 [Providencia rettgeri]